MTFQNTRVPKNRSVVTVGKFPKGPAEYRPKVLLLAPKLSTGKLPDGTKAENLLNSSEGIDHFGAGSPGALMTDMLFKANQAIDLDAIAIPEADGATAATGSLAFTGTATRNGTMTIKAGTARVKVAIAKDDIATAIATAAVAAMAPALEPALPFTAAVNEAAADLTAKYKSTIGNKIPLEVTFDKPLGITVAITDFDNGATDPDLDDTDHLWSSDEYNVVVNPFVDADNLAIIREIQESAWGAERGHTYRSVQASIDAYSTAAALAKGAAMNERCAALVWMPEALVTPCELAAAIGGLISASTKPTKTFIKQSLYGFGIEFKSTATPPDESTINNALYNGLSPIAKRGGYPMIMWMISTQVTDLNGNATVDFLPFHFVEAASEIRKYLDAEFTRAESAAGDDGYLMYDNKPDIVKALTYGAMIKLSEPPYEWVSKAKLEANKDVFLAEVDISGMRVSNEALMPIIPPCLGVDTELYLV